MSAHNAVSELGAGEQYGGGAGNRNVTALTAGAAIPNEAVFITVTAGSGGATDVIVLPPPAVGRVIRGYIGATGCALRATGTGVKINDVVATTAVAAIPATTLFRVECVSSTQWILTAWTELGAEITAIIPA